MWRDPLAEALLLLVDDVVTILLVQCVVRVESISVDDGSRSWAPPIPILVAVSDKDLLSSSYATSRDEKDDPARSITKARRCVLETKLPLRQQQRIIATITCVVSKSSIAVGGA
jgi:hypothetical protein